MICERLRPFGTTVFSEMTRLAIEHEAINLAQGFPDFEGPERIRESAVEALRGGANQYARSQGLLSLVEAVAAKVQRDYALEYDPETEVGIYSGATEGIAAAVLGLLEPGDEVILFEPFYDSYPALVALAGGTPRFHTLRFPELAIDPSRLASIFNDRTRLLILNTPHNPTGKVFRREELELIADLCQRHDALVLADEVYEHLTFDGIEHVPIASLPGMRDRTLTLSSSGKTFSYTGWKIGWGTGSRELVSAAQSAHQFLTFCSATPLQHAIAAALPVFGREYFDTLRAEYQERRDLLLDALRKSGFRPVTPEGTYFILADFSGISSEDDRSFAHRLTREVGVAAIPPSAFYKAEVEEGRRLLRFAFCKQTATLRAAAERLLEWRRGD